ncbi:MAG: DUF1028 domain-containing protein [Phycisphaeraceae bacterium]|nr:DUF1028 domain-containing protein [Phycisphaeraceae bacterium]MCW5761886.1 DUF1028 domain-containing protein [Phycisphaeraceae bacterium]
MFRRVCLGASIVLTAGHASATWSILIVDTRTGEIGLASATCLTNTDLLQLTPVMLGGVGGATAQSFGDTTGQNRTFIRDRLLEGVAPADILPLLDAFDSGHQTRQYGLIDVNGGVATFSGTGAGAWAGGVTGKIGDYVYAVQGNVLTGSPVVMEAEHAIITTSGDLPDKLMASMQAARAMGGDGRCSCVSNNPTGCGSPPPAPFKSADIGYMIIARAGDFNASNGVYGIGGEPVAITVSDFDHDGKPDVIATRFDGVIHLFQNTTAAGSPFTTLAPAGTLNGPAQPIGLALHDVDGDGLDDLLAGAGLLGAVRVFVGLPGGGFAFSQDAPTGITGTGVDIKVGLGGVLMLTNTTLGVLDPAHGWSLDASLAVGPGAVRVAPDPGDDARAFVATSAGQVHQVRRDKGTLTIEQTLSIGWNLIAISAGDVNADGRTDLLVVADTNRSAALLIDDGQGGFTRQDFALEVPGRAAMMADFDGDGFVDPAVISHGFATLFIIRNHDNTTYTLEDPRYVTRSTRHAVAVDMNGDGLPEVVSGGFNSRAVVIADNFDGRFAEDLGAAGGNYFMHFNVPNARRTDPDPVDQLQDRFDLWRADLIGRPDAIESHAVLNVLAVPIGSTRTVTMTITLLDWTGARVTNNGVSITVAHEPDSAGVSEIGAVVAVGDGVYCVTLAAGDTAGRDRFRITADDGVRPVVLMPSPTLRTVDAIGDFDGDGVVSFFDVQAFLQAFSAHLPIADLNSDGKFDIADVQIFLDILSQ